MTATSQSEKDALADFYHTTNGEFWRNNENWLSGDPCTNIWFGVTCNKKGNIIALHFFENHLDGILPDSISNLIYLKHFTIANDGREHEGVANNNMNSIYVWNDAITGITSLEEINF
jgi:hypothetical protein